MSEGTDDEPSASPESSELRRLLGLLLDCEATMAANAPVFGPHRFDATVRGYITALMRGTASWIHLEAARKRYFIVTALGRLADADATMPLLERVNDTDLVMRRYVVGALGMIGDVRAVPALLKALQDSEPRIRRRAAISLGQVADLAALDPLLTALQDPDDATRMRAAEALGALRNSRTVRPLGLVLGRPCERWYVRKAAARALGWLGDAGRTELVSRSERDSKIRPWTDAVLRRMPAAGSSSDPKYPLVSWYRPRIRNLGAKRRGNHETDFLRDAPTD